jgi:transposase
MIFVGVDWAEAHHDVHVADEEGRRLSKARLPEGVEGIARFHELVGVHVEDPEQVVIGIETDRGLFVSALVAARYQLYAVNPMSTSRYRDRHSTSGAKSDAGDAEVLSDMVRTDRHHHRLVAADTDEVEALKVLAGPISQWCGPRAARPTCCARRCASSTPPPCSPLMT